MLPVLPAQRPKELPLNPDQILATITDVGFRAGLLAHFAAGAFVLRPFEGGYFGANRAVASAFREAGFATPVTVIATGARR